MLPPCSIHWMWGSRKTSSDGLANKKQQAMQHDEVTVLLYTFHLSADPTLIQIDKQLF